MKSILKKGAVIILAISVCLAMSVTAFAANPATADKTITVTDVEEGATVTAYQIVKEENGHWVAIANSADQKITISNDSVVLSAKEVTNLANNTNGLPNKAMEYSATDKSYLATVDPGMYLVVVTKTGTPTVYNPMVVSADYNAANKPTISAKSDFEVGSAIAYAKSSKPTITKDITSGTGTTASGTTTKGDSVAVGDKVDFQISSTIPSYSDDYATESLTYSMTDTLTAGFADPTDITVKIGDQTLDPSDYTLTPGNPFTVKLDGQTVHDNGLKTMTVTYSAVLESATAFNFDSNDNTAKLTYSNDPSSTGTATPITAETHNYTFGIDASLTGKDITGKKTTHEIIKTDSSDSAGQLISATETQETKEFEGALQGATFGLYKGTDTTVDPVAKATSNEKGYLEMKGLDEGTYTLKEITAPNGYALDPSTHTVVISAVYNPDGTLASYSVTIDDNSTSTYTATYENNELKEITGDSTTTVIKNSTLGGLPTTGGMGTYIFIIIGITIIAVAAGMAIRRRRAENEQ